jgi:PAS domain S-box-containing protein
LQSVNEELSTVNGQLWDKVERLNAANSNMTNFIESTEIATLFLDRDLRIKLFTPATTRVLKVIPSDTGRPINDLSLNLTDFDLLSDARAVVAGRGVVEREVQHADGSRYLVRVLPYRTQSGEIDGVVVTFSDITRLRQAEKQTRRLATVVMDSNDAIILFDLKGNIMSWNRGARDMYGWSEAEALKMTIRNVIPPDKINESSDLLRRMAAGETITSFETQRIAKDGRILDIWLTATSVLDAAGKNVEAFATTERDITERKRTENALRSAHAELEQRAFELNAVNRELDAFAYTVANDLKAPLRSIEGFAGAIMEDYDDKLDDTGKDYMQRVISACLRMNQLIDAMLSMARLTGGELHEKTVDLSDLASVIAHGLRENEPQRRVEFIISPKVKIRGDATMLKIVLQNLLENSWKFTSKHPVARIEFGVKDMEGKAVYFVRDDGAGFDMKYADQLFQPFKRMHTEAEYAGLGIGLATAYRIITRHGGRMWAEGKVEQGATFYFSV